MFRDLTHDAVPLGNNNSAPPIDASSPSQPQCAQSNGDDPSHEAFKVPKVVHITGSKGVQIGPVYHIQSPIIQQAAGSGKTSNIFTEPQKDPRPPRDNVLQMLQVTREINESDKSVVSEHLGDLWRQLGREMEYSSGQLDNIGNDHRRLQDKTYELLTMWHDKESSVATFAQLTRLLLRIRAFELVNILYRTIQR